MSSKPSQKQPAPARKRPKKPPAAAAATAASAKRGAAPRGVRKPRSKPREEHPPTLLDIQDLFSRLALLDGAAEAPLDEPPEIRNLLELVMDSDDDDDAEDEERLLTYRAHVPPPSFKQQQQLPLYEPKPVSAPPGFQPDQPAPRVAAPTLGISGDDGIWHILQRPLTSTTTTSGHRAPQEAARASDSFDGIDLGPPPGILGTNILERRAEPPPPSGSAVLLKKINPMNVPRVVSPPPPPPTAAAQEDKDLLAYQSDFPVLDVADEARTTNSVIRPLTKQDKHKPYPEPWVQVPKDLNPDVGVWLTAQEAGYVAAQQIAQTTRAQTDFTRPRTLEQDVGLPAPATTSFIFSVPARRCICHLLELGGFGGPCTSRYCVNREGSVPPAMWRGLAARINLAHEAAENLAVALPALCCLEDVVNVEDPLAPSVLGEAGFRLVDLTARPQGTKTLVDVWMGLVARDHPARLTVLFALCRNSALFTAVCAACNTDDRFLGALDDLRYVGGTNTRAHFSALAYNVELICSQMMRSSFENPFAQLGVLTMLCFLDVLRTKQSLTLLLARLVYEGIVDSLHLLDTTPIPPSLVKNAVKLDPTLLPAVTSAPFLTLMSALFLATSKLPDSEQRPPPVLANTPLTHQSAYRLLYRLLALATVEVLSKDPGARSGARLFLQRSLLAARQDNFCASALHEAASSDCLSWFGSPEDFVLWLCGDF